MRNRHCQGQTRFWSSTGAPRGNTEAQAAKRLGRRRRIPHSVLSILLPFVLLAAPSTLTTRLHAQTIPQIIGDYLGSGSTTITFDDSGSIMTLGPIPTFAMLTVQSQQGGSFSGTGVIDGLATEAVAGTVDANGQLSGSFNTNDAGGQFLTINGTFTGQIAAGQIQLTFTATLTATNQPEGESITESGSAMMTSSSMAANSDLSIKAGASSSKVASGQQITYTATVANAGPDDAMAVLVTFPTPAGTTVAAVSSSQGEVPNVIPGSTGNVTFLLGTVAKGANATASLTVNVLASGGETITAMPSVISDSKDPNMANNMATVATPVAGGAVIELVWDQPAPTTADPTPAPENLRVISVIPPGGAQASERIRLQGSCAIVDINVYKSDQPDVQPIPANLWETVAPDLLMTTMAKAPKGSFYVITNVWDCGGVISESPPSNEANSPAGPTINKLKVGAKLKATGSSFSGPVTVTVNGVGFMKSAVVQGSTTVVQKGLLSDGTSISAIGVTAPATIQVTNADGGVGTFMYKKP